MIFAIITLLSGLAISFVAAYYSIIGLTTIFSGSIMAVAIMGAVLEIGKLVTASWLKQNWNIAGFLMKTYLTIAVIVLMFITSMGIFGYLSKAHLQQTSGINQNHSKIEKIDFDISQQEKKIERSQNNLERSQTMVDKLDSALKVYIEKEYVTRALKERAKQKEEREQLKKEQEAYEIEITEATEKIGKLNEKKFEYQQKVQEIEVEVGPIKYIADLVYGEEKSKGMLNDAVRMVILILIFVFDPLAVLMLLAANISFIEVLKNRNKKNTSKELKFADSLEEPKTSMLAAAKKPISKKSKTIKTVDSKEFIENAFKKEEDAGPITDWLPAVTEAHKASRKNNLTGSTNHELIENLWTGKPIKEIKAPDLPEEFFVEHGFTQNNNKKTLEDITNSEDETILEEIKNLQSEKELLDWKEKIIQDSILTKEDMSKAIENSFEQAIGKANIPFNLNSPEGEELKKIIIRNLQKEYK